MQELVNDGWYYDFGDDPSFYSRELTGHLTWGVCRADVRSQVDAGDVIAFFAFRNREHSVTDYYFVAFASVLGKIDQRVVFTEPNWVGLRNQLNLLIRPHGQIQGCWEHFEPFEGCFHPDWLARISQYKAHDVSALKTVGRNSVISDETQVSGDPFRFGVNYVIFDPSPQVTFLLESPIHVARSVGLANEIWETTSAANLVFNFTLAKIRAQKPNRSLRTKNSQRPHVPLRLTFPDAGESAHFKNEFRKALVAHGVRFR